MYKSDNNKPVVLVTGASRGIGKAIAVAFAHAGFNVAIAARTLVEGTSQTINSAGQPFTGSIESTANEIRQTGAACLPLQINLLDRQSINNATGKLMSEWGRIDALVNNAHHVENATGARFIDIDADGLSRVFDANVVNVGHLVQWAVKAMIAQGNGGAIVNMSSAVSRLAPTLPVGAGGWPYGYSAGKSAFSRIAEMVHVEHQQDGISTFNLEPAGIPTQSFLESIPPEMLEIIRNDPKLLAAGQEEMFTPNVPAVVAAWLATAPEARELSGQTIDCAQLCRQHQLMPESEMVIDNFNNLKL